MSALPTASKLGVMRQFAWLLSRQLRPELYPRPPALCCAGERLFGFLTPPAMGRHRPYFTCTAVAVLLLVFFFMAGESHFGGACPGVCLAASCVCRKAAARCVATPPGATLE